MQASENYLLTINFTFMSKNKNTGLLMLWFVTLLMTCLAIAADRQLQRLNRENFSLNVQASGKFDRKVYTQNWVETTGGAEACFDKIAGIRLLGDTVVYDVRNKVSFNRGDSVYIVSKVALPCRPVNQQMVRDALSPSQNSVRWTNIVCLLFWLAAVWKTWNRLYG